MGDPSQRQPYDPDDLMAWRRNQIAITYKNRCEGHVWSTAGLSPVLDATCDGCGLPFGEWLRTERGVQ
jgi:hypothetical protein